MGKEATILLFLGVVSLRICFAASASASLNKSSVDEVSLLSIKTYINSDILATNWSKETSFCTWIGVICGERPPDRVTGLHLSSMGLRGSIAIEIGNLSFLKFLDMSNNSINDLIPGEIGLLRNLQGLNLSNNYLSGDIPSSLSGCAQLKMFDLSRNSLSGHVPSDFGNWSQLQKLSLMSNYLTGKVPPSIGNLSNLEVLDISENSFYGALVPEMGQLSSLRVLNLGANNLSGEVPQAIFNLSVLEILSLRENDLSGSLPFSIDKGLPNIQQVFLGNIHRRSDPRANQFHGKIPNSISNLSKLTTLDLSDNSFTHVPMNLGSLHQLQLLNLEANQLTNNLSNPEQDFLSSLAACKNLKSIRISFNLVTGVLPKSLGSSNLSASLETLKAFSCRLLDPIPDEIGNLSNLLWLNLGYNHFTGAIPSMLGHLRSLRNLEIYGNRFHGSISPVLCNLNYLYSLNLAMNCLSELPSCLGSLSLLREIYMSRNEFNSNIASIPWFTKGVSNVKNLVALDLSRNQLSGEIPSTISRLENLVRLSLSRNKLKGPLVESFADLKDLQHLDLSHNNLSGPIPKSFEALSHLNYFDMSFNELSGEIPHRGCFQNFTAEFFIGNEGLCGAAPFNVKKCKSLSLRKHLSYISVLTILVIGLILILIRKISARKPSFTENLNLHTYGRISYHEILHATGNFDEKNLIGRGGIGSVYKGFFSDGVVHAVKVFDLNVQDALKSFNTECEILSRVRHRNIVKIITLSHQIDFKAMVVTYMPNGDLENWLHSATCSLTLFTRLRIMTEVACVVEYLHDEYHTSPIVHCDLNPNNILLDEDMVAHVCDFGIAKVLSQEERMLHSSTLGTVGYIAPEYGSRGLISTTVDVYSYGILLMEMLSRRKPTDEIFSGELTLRRWVLELFPGSVLQIIDDEQFNMYDEATRVRHECWLTSAVELALDCSADLPEERPNMKEVVVRIMRIDLDFKKVAEATRYTEDGMWWPDKEKMAYAAMVSLAQTIDRILNHGQYSVSAEVKQHILSLDKLILSWQESFEMFPENAKSLVGRITELANEAEDIIEYLMLEQVSLSYDVVSECNPSGKYEHQLKEVTKEIDSIGRELTQIKDSFRSKDVQPGAGSSDLSSSPSAAPIHKDAMVGFNDDALAIKDRLCSGPSKLQVIPICGMGGIGKTTLAKNVYDDPLTMYHFEIRVWVTISQDCSAQRILSSLLDSMKEFNTDGLGQRDEEKVRTVLMSRRYLVVMDDMWNSEAWDVVRNIFPDDRNGSRIMLTTRLSDVACYPDPGSDLHEMRLMDADQSWNLLKQTVSTYEDYPFELENVGKEIARSCKGLPLAIVVIAGILSRKNPASWWEIAEYVKSADTANHGQIEDILSLSYTHLPQYLRPCFLYMGFFPEDHEIRVSKLTKLWVAEGFLKRPNGSGSLEDEAEECLEDLVKRNLVLVTKRKSDGRIKTCSLHDLVLDLCIRKAYESKFFLNLMDRYVGKQRFIESTKNQRRINVDSSSLTHLSSIHDSTIHTIMCSRNHLVVLNFIKSVKLLRVLDAEPAYMESLPDQLFDLFHLRYLALRCSHVIPRAISKLQNLQTLIIHKKMRSKLLVGDPVGCHMKPYMQEIWKMPQLRHLYSSFVISLYIQEGTTSALENLQTLSYLSHHSCTERIFEMIPNLKKLAIDCSCTHYDEGKASLHDLVHLHQLENLEIYAGHWIKFWPKYYSFTFPTMLRKLTLRSLRLPWDEMTVVGSLPNLQVLKIREDSMASGSFLRCALGDGVTWETIEGGFLQLEFLLIEGSYLEHWITENSHFPILKRLMLYDCPRLCEIPEGIAEIPTLELIEVRGKKSLAESAKRIQGKVRSTCGLPSFLTHQDSKRIHSYEVYCGE